MTTPTTPRNRRRRRGVRPLRLRDDVDDTCQLPRFPPTTSPISTRSHGRRGMVRAQCAVRALVPKSALCAAVTVTEWQIFGPRTGGREPAEGNLLGYRSDEIATSPGRRPRILHGFCRTSRLGPSKPRQHGESMGRPRDTVVMTRRKEARRGMTRAHISRDEGRCASRRCVRRNKIPR